MSEPERQKRMDDLLDSLLVTYSDVEPRPGMETRLLAALRAGTAPTDLARHWFRRWWLAGAAVAAVAAVVLAIYWPQIPPIPQLPRIQMAGPPTLASLPAISALGESGHRKSRRASGPNAPPSATLTEVRQAIFPTPTPLSEQEQLLLRYLAATPRKEIVAQSHEDEPAEDAAPLGPQVEHSNGIEGQKFGNEDAKEKL